MKILPAISLSIPLLISCNQAAINDANTAADNIEKPKENVSVLLARNKEASFIFNNDELGKIPSGWSNYLTAKGKLGQWEILDDNGNKVLAQTSKENFGYHFDVIVNDFVNYKDLEFTLKFKGVEGQEDQGGGPVWRYQDANNYYVARANPLENNYRVYKVVNGNRKMLKSIDIEVNTDQWYGIKIIMKGDNIQCYLNGKLQLSTIDSTFPSAGKIGLWTKADAVTYFDNIHVSNTGDTYE
jgi:hypothetical protein